MARKYGSRVEDWQYQLLDRNDNLIGELKGVQPGGEYTLNVDADIRGSGSFTLNTLNRDIDWEATRIRISYLRDDLAPKPLCTVLPKLPSEDFDVDSSARVGIFDKTQILLDEIGTNYGLAAGTPIITAVQNLITGVGETSMLLQPSAKTLASDLSWDPNTTRLRIINDLLDAAGYFSIYTDPLGRYRADPYVDPSNRPIVWPFEDDERTGLYLPKFTRTRDTSDIPNRIKCIQRTDGETEALVAIAVAPPSSQFSYENRGYWKTKTYTDIEAADAPTLQLITNRKLSSALQVSASFAITHPVLDIAPNNIVTFYNSKIGQRARCVCRALSYKLSVGGLVNGTYREVVT